jgi:hypothetical protein
MFIAIDRVARAVKSRGWVLSIKFDRGYLRDTFLSGTVKSYD